MLCHGSVHAHIVCLRCGTDVLTQNNERNPANRGSAYTENCAVSFTPINEAFAQAAYAQNSYFIVADIHNMPHKWMQCPSKSDGGT